MTEITRIFDTCYGNNQPSEPMQLAWQKMLSYMTDNFPHTVCEIMTDYICEITNASEQQAFIDGFKQAFHLWVEVQQSHN